MNRDDRLAKLAMILKSAEGVVQEPPTSTVPKPIVPEIPKIDRSQLYPLFTSTPYGNFTVTNDAELDKAIISVLSGIKSDFSAAPNLSAIESAFNQSVQANNINDIKSSFDAIAAYKNKQKETEKTAFDLVNLSLTKIANSL